FVSKISMGRPGGDDQKVVVEDLLLRYDSSLFQIGIDHFFKQHFNIGVGSKNPTNGRCNLSRRQAGGSDLVEQRLKGMVIFPVNDRDVAGEPRDPAGGGQAPETSPLFSGRRRHTRLVSDWSSDVCSSD